MNRLTDRLRVAALPLDIAFADKKANREAVEKAFGSLPEGTDLVVLPELFSTGYTDDPDLLREMAEKNTSRTMDFIKGLAAQHGTAIAGSFLAYTAPGIYNRAFFIEPSGEETFYDKHHLFSVSSEAKLLHRGIDPVRTVRFRGWNIATIICYDLRFPVWCRNRHNRYDLLLVPANWPAARGYAWKHLLIARAIENQCAVVGANRGGHDRYGDYDGQSYIFDCHGISSGHIVGPFVCSDLSREAQEEYREKFPVASDADDFSID